MFAEPGPGASGIPGGASYREEDQMPSGPVYGASPSYADLFSPLVAGLGGGTR